MPAPSEKVAENSGDLRKRRHVDGVAFHALIKLVSKGRSPWRILTRSSAAAGGRQGQGTNAIVNVRGRQDRTTCQGRIRCEEVAEHGRRQAAPDVSSVETAIRDAKVGPTDVNGAGISTSFGGLGESNSRHGKDRFRFCHIFRCDCGLRCNNDQASIGFR